MNYIDKIGFEFEGYYKSKFHIPYLDEYKTDASLGDGWAGYTPREAITKPVGIDKIKKILSYMKKKEKAKHYICKREQVGLHYHISIKKQFYPYLVTYDFFNAYKELLKTLFNNMYEDRNNCSGGFASAEVDESHFNLQSPRRYKIINYSYRKHSTIEFRAYGGEYSTGIQGLELLVNKTIQLINKTISSARKDKKNNIRFALKEVIAEKQHLFLVDDEPSSTPYQFITI